MSHRARSTCYAIAVASLIVVAGCHDSTAPAVPAVIVFTGAPAVAVVGHIVSPAPGIEIRDAKGNPLSGIAFTVVVSGGGALTGTPAKTSSGSTSLGTWTLGTVAGTQTLEVNAAGLPALIISATANPGTPVTETSGGAALAGIGFAALAAPLTPSIRVTDAFGNGVPSVAVSVRITGGGSVQFASPTTNSGGVASAGVWTLGSALGPQTITLTASGLAPVLFTVTTIGTFTVDVRYAGTPPTPDIQAAFTAAALRVEQVITSKLTPINAANLNLSPCGVGPIVLNETIESVVIYAKVAPIDGVGGILGQSGPCLVRTGSTPATSLPVVGVMQFDSADLAALAANGTLASVITHEMQHVLGYGTLWAGPPSFPVPLMQGARTTNPIYLGAAARAEYLAAGGTAPVGVPLQGFVNGAYLAGTSDSHWPLSFGTELMIGYISQTPLAFSRISIAALVDLGYSVSFATADSYALPMGALRSLFAPPALSEFSEQLIMPQFKIDKAGRVTHLAQ